MILQQFRRNILIPKKAKNIPINCKSVTDLRYTKFNNCNKAVFQKKKNLGYNMVFPKLYFPMKSLYASIQKEKPLTRNLVSFLLMIKETEKKRGFSEINVDMDSH